MGYLNLGSLILGLVAWLLPIILLMLRNKIGEKNRTLLIFLSLSACAISLCMQIIYRNYLVETEDWTALLDVSPTVTKASMQLLVVTIVLNALAFIVGYRKK